MLVAACGAGHGGVPTSGAARAPVTHTSAGRDVTTTEPERGEGHLVEDVLGDADVWVSIGQSRHLEGTSRIVVPLRFDGDEPVTVSSIAVRAPWFEPLPPEPKRSLLHPGRTVDVQVDLGPARCDGVEDPEGGGTVEVVAALDGRTPTLLVLPLPTWLLEQLHRRECTLSELARAVAVDFAGTGEVSGRQVLTEIIVRRQASSDAITVERIAGSVILALEPVAGGAPVAELPPGAQEVRVPVLVTAARCDPHGLSGSQKTFVFPAWVAVGDAEAVFVELRPGPDLEAAMRAAITTCIEN